MLSLASDILSLASGMPCFSFQTPCPPVAQARPPGKQQEIRKKKEHEGKREGRAPTARREAEQIEPQESLNNKALIEPQKEPE